MEKWLIQYLSQVSPVTFCVVAAAIFVLVIPGIIKYGGVIIEPFRKLHAFINEREARENQLDKNTEDIATLKQEFETLKTTHTHDIEEVENKASARKHQSEEIVATWRDELNSIIEMLNTIRREATERDIKQMRYKIIRFSKELRCGDPKSQDEFNHVFETIDDYHKVLDELELENGQIDIEVAYINSKYMSLLETNGLVR